MYNSYLVSGELIYHVCLDMAFFDQDREQEGEVTKIGCIIGLMRHAGGRWTRRNRGMARQLLVIAWLGGRASFFVRHFGASCSLGPRSRETARGVSLPPASGGLCRPGTSDADSDVTKWCGFRCWFSCCGRRYLVLFKTLRGYWAIGCRHRSRTVWRSGRAFIFSHLQGGRAIGLRRVIFRHALEKPGSILKFYKIVD